MIEIVFLFAFTLHNIEEGIWLPAWSKYAGKYHPEVAKNEFHFAVIIVTAAGYLLTFLFFLFGQSWIIRYLYLAFVSMMALNAVFPHLAATIMLKKYAPGTITGLFLNLPVGGIIIYNNLKSGTDPLTLVIAFAAVTITILSSLRLLFKIGGRIIDKY